MGKAGFIDKGVLIRNLGAYSYFSNRYKAHNLITISASWVCQTIYTGIFTLSKQAFNESLDFLQPFIAS